MINLITHTNGFITVIRDNGERDGVIHPGQDLTGKEQEIADFAAEVWTPEVLEAYAAQQESAQ